MQLGNGACHSTEIGHHKGGERETIRDVSVPLQCNWPVNLEAHDPLPSMERTLVAIQKAGFSAKVVQKSKKGKDVHFLLPQNL